MTLRELLINLLTDPQDEDWHELYNNVTQLILSTVIAGCAILSLQKFLR